VIGLSGSGLVLEDNGADDLSVTASGTFTFKTTIASGNAYAVTVKTQPSSPTQNCVVSAGIGKAQANVSNIQVTCGNTFSVGGTVTGMVGAGLVLQDNGGDNLTIASGGTTGAANFTFATNLSSGAAYAVTILTQPSGPGQTCSVTNGSGKATGNVSTVQIVCPQPTFTIGGTVVGLVDGAGNTVEVLNNGGDNTLVTGNNTAFSFPTTVTNNGRYDVSILAEPTSQPQACNLFFYTGVAKADVSSVIVDCQHNDWTWINGPNSTTHYGAFAIPPKPPLRSANVPGGREYAATWTDSGGRKWLFGGFGLDLTGAIPPDAPGLLNDLWLWSGTDWIPAGLTLTQTTVAGVTTSTADFFPIQSTDHFGGTTPGSRWGSVTWSDSTGHLWLFGGQGLSTAGVGFLNDIWEFTPGSLDQNNNTNPITYFGSYTYSGTWTPVSGTTLVNQKGTYGAVGATGFPSARWGASQCTDSTGNLWVFGGQGIDGAGTLGLLNDLWRYNIASQTWTWMGPTNSNVGQNNGVYGTQGTALAANAPGPGGRQTALLWADKSGNIWLFGGLGLDSVGTRSAGSLSGGLPNGQTPDGALLNDLWKFNIATGQWTWVSGGAATGLADQTGVYGTAQVAAATNVPGSRWSMSGFSDASGNLWLFGGWGYASSLAQNTGYLNDVWEYQQSSKQWIWWKGSSDVNQAGSYPTEFSVSLGVPFVLNTPGSRRGVAFWPQQDSGFYFWTFGGEGYDATGQSGYMNDTWNYLPFP
jgi:N-acetylneuraminic acid mutarotase